MACRAPTLPFTTQREASGSSVGAPYAPVIVFAHDTARDKDTDREQLAGMEGQPGKTLNDRDANNGRPPCARQVNSHGRRARACFAVTNRA
jgi:hypothetical protein